MKSEKGITIIALIITIIILLLLSSVAISTFTDDGSLVSTVKNQRNEVIQTNIKQEVDIAIEKVKLENVSDNLTIEEFTQKLLERLNKNDGEAQVEVRGDNQYMVTYKGNVINYYY